MINISFGAAAWFIGSAALSPVTRLRRSAADIVSKPGTELLPVDSAGDEISDLARTLNELITNLRASAERERQIVSDASHEFRTPLAIIQTRLELAQRQANTLEEMQVDVSAAQKAIGRLSALATSMLELSRIDAQNEPGRAASLTSKENSAMPSIAAGNASPPATYTSTSPARPPHAINGSPSAMRTSTGLRQPHQQRTRSARQNRRHRPSHRARSGQSDAHRER